MGIPARKTVHLIGRFDQAERWADTCRRLLYMDTQRALCSAAHRNPSCTSLSRYKRTHSLSGPAEVQRLGNHTPVSTEYTGMVGRRGPSNPQERKTVLNLAVFTACSARAQTRSDKVCKYAYRHQGTQTTTVLNLAVSCHALPGPNKVRQHQKSGTPYRRHPGPDGRVSDDSSTSPSSVRNLQLRQHCRL
jgi:hypothetical protein